MSERTRFERLEIEEQPRRRTAPRARAQEGPATRAVTAAPPGATFTESPHLEPILQNTLAPAGRTEFHYLYDQIAALAAGVLGGGGPLSPNLDDIGDVNITNPQDGDILVYDSGTETWINEAIGGGGASLSVANTWTAAQTFCVDDTANNAVSRAVTVCHTSSDDLATAGIGSGVNFAVESSLGGANVTLAQIDAQSSALGSGAGAETGRLLVNLASAGVITNELLFAPQQFTITRSPLAASTRSLVQIGAGPWHFGGGTPGGNLTHGNAQGNLLGLNQTAGYTGYLLVGGVGGVPRAILAGSGAHSLRVYDTTAAGEVPALELYHRLSSGTATVGQGVALDLYGQTAAGAALLHGSVWTQTEDISAGVEEIGLVFSCRVAGTFGERARFSGETGNLNVQADIATEQGVNVGTFLNRAGWLDIHPVAVSAPTDAQIRLARIVGPAHTDVGIAADLTEVSITSGAIALDTGSRAALIHPVAITGPTYSAAGASTLDTVTGLYVNPPVAGTNVTITNRYAIYANGPVRIDQAGGATFVLEVPEDNTALGAAVGRIPIMANGTIYYIPYHAAA